MDAIGCSYVSAQCSIFLKRGSFTPPTNGHHNIMCPYSTPRCRPNTFWKTPGIFGGIIEIVIVLDIYNFRQNKILAALPPLPWISPPLTVGLNWQTTGKHLRPWPKPTGQTSRIKIFASTSSDHLPSSSPPLHHLWRYPRPTSPETPLMQPQSRWTYK